jgi:hypothetical protein
MTMDRIETVKSFLREYNGGSGEMTQVLHEEIVREHRFIQGTIIGSLCRVLYKIGKYNHGMDARNECAINLCKALVEIADKGEVSKGNLNILRQFFF